MGEKKEVSRNLLMGFSDPLELIDYINAVVLLQL